MLGDPGNDVGRTSALPIEFGRHRKDAGRRIVPRLALHLQLVLVQRDVHGSSIEQVR